MSDNNKGVNIKNDGENAADAAPTPQNTPIFNAPIAAAAAAAAAASSGADSTGEGVGPVQNAALLSMLQGRLGSLIGASSGYIESLPKGVRERVDGLRYLQKQHTEIDAKFHLEILELEKKYNKLYAPLYERRNAIITGSAEPTDDEKAEGAKIAAAEREDDDDAGSAEGLPASGIEEVTDGSGAEDGDEKDASAVAGVPEFWLTVLSNHPQLSELISERDTEAIKQLRDIRLVYLEEKNGFKLEFVFDENAYFTNEVLTKTYYYEQSEVTGDLQFGGAEGCEINWKPENDLSVTVETKKQRHKATNRTRIVKKTVPAETFFSFFLTIQEPEDDDDTELADETRDRIELDYELAEEFKEKIIPNAIDWFTGKALEYEGLGPDEYDEDLDDFYDDDESDDYDDDDDSDDDDEEDGLSRSAKEASEPPQCKNQ